MNFNKGKFQKVPKCVNCLIPLNNYRCKCGKYHGLPSPHEMFCLNCYESADMRFPIQISPNPDEDDNVDNVSLQKI